ncbi:MAG: class I SAM-dependent methyltransferase [Bacteroidetes bacterium]|nr:class I SAM-dependent methyltransferase [Fibrella sp.]
MVINQSRRVADVLLLPLTLICSVWLKFVVRKSFATMPLTEFTFLRFGFLPIRDHYYHPLVNPGKHLKGSLREDRPLPGLDLNVTEQLALLSQFTYADELTRFPLTKTKNREYYYDNGAFASGDSEYLYNMIRHHKPKRIIEIGSGHSTLMAINATKRNKRDNSTHTCEHTCIEPYEMPWLEQTGVKVIRQKVEEVDQNLFKSLKEGDILFIDSSHVIRPQGDVLTEYLEILPLLNPGVLVHIHDIFSPRDYLNEWVYKEHFLWNEQYLLEAFLSFNKAFKVLAAVNYLKHNHGAALGAKCPILAQQPNREPGSFWIQRT